MISLFVFRTRVTLPIAVLGSALLLETACGGMAGGESDLVLGVCEAAADPNGGWIGCGQGFLHRVARAQCPSSVPRPDPVWMSDVYTPDQVECMSDAECAHLPHGYCWGTYWLPPRCVAGCVVDSDCNAGGVCFCDEPVGRCVHSSGCAIDDDCGAGSFCATYTATDGCGGHPAIGVACQTDADECTGRDDCPSAQAAPLCGYEPAAGRRVCGLAAGGCSGQ
jgi:hypothetical protein